MEGQASISTEILGRYAADAAREIVGVRELPGRRAVKVALGPEFEREKNDEEDDAEEGGEAEGAGLLFRGGVGHGRMSWSGELSLIVVGC